MNEKNEREKVKTVVSKPAKIKKKSEIKKFTDSFIVEDANNVGSYLLRDVLIPSGKKLIADLIKDAIDMFLYGDSGRQNRKRSGSRISYDNYYNDRDDKRRNTYHSRSSLDYGDIILDSRGEAEVVIDGLNDIIGRYQFASVADLYDLAGISNDNYTLNRYGWTNIRNAQIKRVRDGYLLMMPKAVPID